MSLAGVSPRRESPAAAAAMGRRRMPALIGGLGPRACFRGRGRRSGNPSRSLLRSRRRGTAEREPCHPLVTLGRAAALLACLSGRTSVVCKRGSVQAPEHGSKRLKSTLLPTQTLRVLLAGSGSASRILVCSVPTFAPSARTGSQRDEAVCSAPSRFGPIAALFPGPYSDSNSSHGPSSGAGTAKS